jgi:CBS domain-containing protein
MPNVANVLHDKPSNAVYSIQPEATVIEAIRLMAEKGIGALVVTDSDNHVVGIFSERDYTRKVALLERTSKDTTVSEIMTTHVFTVTKMTKVSDCLDIMTQNHLRHLPVIDEHKKLTAMVSIGDLVKAVMDEQRRLIEQLESYIAG